MMDNTEASGGKYCAYIIPHVKYQDLANVQVASRINAFCKVHYLPNSDVLGADVQFGVTAKSP